MSVRVAINGFGRIGRNVLRCAKQAGNDLDLVAVNDLTDSETLAHLLRYARNKLTRCSTCAWIIKIPVDSRGSTKPYELPTANALAIHARSWRPERNSTSLGSVASGKSERISWRAMSAERNADEKT